LHQKQEKMQKRKVMFQNPVFELLSRSNPLIIFTLHLLLISLIYSYGLKSLELKFSYQIYLFISGLITWTLAEYLIHRFVFHWTSQRKFLKVVHYALHGHHHDNPTDKNHLFMPPIPVVLLVILLFSFFFMLMGRVAYFFFPGFEMGYLIYSMIHYSVHLKPYSKGIMKKLWIHHGKHHYENSSARYGVSNTFWDYIFQTLPKDN
jgi:sterol desaturase/sphingolipid hydroxylase (fatty acid hydroxylase superfamily)